MMPLGNNAPPSVHPSLAGLKGREMGLENVQQARQGEKTQRWWVIKVCYPQSIE